MPYRRRNPEVVTSNLSEIRVEPASEQGTEIVRRDEGRALDGRTVVFSSKYDGMVVGYEAREMPPRNMMVSSPKRFTTRY
jgi:hypothetical protein